MALSVAVGSQVSQMWGGEVFTFCFLFRRTLRTEILQSGSGVEERRLPRNLRISGHDRVPTGSGVHAATVGTRGRLRVMFPSVLESGSSGEPGADAGADDREPPASMGDKRYTLHSFQVGAAASHHMGGTAVVFLMECVGWRSSTVASRLVGVTASAVASRDQALARHCSHRGKTPYTTVGGVCGMVSIVRTRQAAVVERLRG